MAIGVDNDPSADTLAGVGMIKGVLEYALFKELALM